MQTAVPAQVVSRAQDPAVHPEERDLLRLSTAGSVDDGKSTLIGRLLYDSRSLYEDQIASVQKATINRSSHAFDLALFTDGLRTEREQGITIDVAYRYFSTPRRKFIIADTPGHEEYTRNMATGASTANLAIILVDARHGVRPQSRRHAFIASLLGIQHIVIAVNKMDLVAYSEQVFESIRQEFSDYAARLQVPDLHFIPISALASDNVVEKSMRMPWFGGSSLLHYLETVHIASDRNLTEFRFPVQYVNRPDADFRGFSGQIASGIVRPGDIVLALPSGRTSRIRSIVTYEGDLDYAFAPMSVTLCLEDEIDIGRGDMLVPPTHPPHVTRHIDSRLVWMHDAPLDPKRDYLLKHASQTVRAAVKGVRYRMNINTLEKESVEQLSLNEIGAVTLETHKSVFCDPYRRNRATGSFILIDPVSNATVAAGMITARDPGRGRSRAVNTGAVSEAPRINAVEREMRSGHRAATIWTTFPRVVAWQLERMLFHAGCQVYAISADEAASHLPQTARILNEAGAIAIVYNGTAGILQQRTRQETGKERFVCIDPPFPESDPTATAESAIRALRECGVLTQSDEII